ncbi:MAG: zinc ribbon domain-containing protein [Candidatus Heimdallarchaeota archaeon]
MSTHNKAIRARNIWILLFGSAVTILGIILLAYGIFATTSIFIIGLIMLISGIASVFAYRHNREKVIGALKSYERISLEQLSKELRLTKRKVQSLIVDLRADCRIRASFEPVTGDVLILEVDGLPPIAIVPMSSSGLPEHEEKFKDKQIPKEHDYCSYCGSILKSNAQFCTNCGTYQK